jgi:hypothetical protein
MPGTGPARLAGGGRVGGAAPRSAGPPGAGERDRLEPGGAGQRQRPGKKGGSETGPNPTDRGKAGSKRHLIVDPNGIPMAVILSAANIHDSQKLEAAIDAIPAIRQCAGRPHHRPVCPRGMAEPSSCTLTRPMTPGAAGGLCVAGASRPASRAAKSSPARGSAAIAGSSSGHWPGSRASAGSWSATSGAATSSPPSIISPLP